MRGNSSDIPAGRTRQQRFCFSGGLYKVHNRIEQFRRIATRCDCLQGVRSIELAAGIVAMIKLACVRL